MQVQRLLVIGLLLLLSACGPTAVGVPGPEEPRPVLRERKPPRVGLVLGGGAARGFAHVGVIRVLEREKIPIDLIVGTSVGSLVGAIYADKKNSFELEWTAFSLEERDLFDYTFISPTQGFVRGERLEEFVSKKVSARELQQLKIPLTVVATDIQSGELVTLQNGSVARAVRASSAIPGIFIPVRYQGRLLVDGGVLNNVPVDVARKLGADVVIAVNLGGGKKAAQVNNVFDAIIQSLHLMAIESTEARLREADVVIEPQVSQIGLIDFGRKKELLTLGIQAAEQVLPRLREKVFGVNATAAVR
ncbi:MAG: patatin-like phospholipase family protein [Deltaproteobacteria bacterium]|nr:patatin-like phospholipase family protein [Deltaproteobacteria bacterium]